VDRAARFIDKGQAHLGAAYGRVNCTSCHGGGGRNRNPN
jgi:mono/diheme cytochrome c family protein